MRSFTKITQEHKRCLTGVVEVYLKIKLHPRTDCLSGFYVFSINFWHCWNVLFLLFKCIENCFWKTQMGENVMKRSWITKVAWGVRIQSSGFRNQLIAISVSICDLSALWKTRNRPSDDSEDNVEVIPQGGRLKLCACQWSRYHVVETADLVMYCFRTIAKKNAIQFRKGLGKLSIWDRAQEVEIGNDQPLIVKTNLATRRKHSHD